MSESLPTGTFEAATIFESGFLHGYRQSEVKGIRFHIAKPRGRSEYPAATLIRRGLRKEETIPAARLVVIEGWNLPVLQTDLVEVSESTTVRTAKFQAFSPEWSDLLDEYLHNLGPSRCVILDGRTLPKPSSAHPVELNALPMEVTDVERLDEAEQFSEGGVEQLLLDRYERDPNARRACIAHHGHRCRACGLTLSDIYGNLAGDYIHVHHRVPLSTSATDHSVDPIQDLVPVCPNCHAMLHRSVPPLAVEELSEIIRKQRR